MTDINTWLNIASRERDSWRRVAERLESEKQALEG